MQYCETAPLRMSACDHHFSTKREYLDISVSFYHIIKNVRCQCCVQYNLDAHFDVTKALTAVNKCLMVLYH